ncbi:MAG: TRAP transporter substrate-binding protein [Deltaproteobacteria bacterium]|nr:TRAP transporter substrate-binding protein [Deltaproteobacteria bacterium]
MKKVCVFGVVAVLSLVWLVCQPVHAQEKTITLKLANYFPPDNKISVAMDAWCKEVEKRTNGKVKPTQFAGGTLSPAAQTYQAVIKGVADMGLSFCSYTMGRFPLSEVVDLPLGYKSGYTATRLANEFYMKFKPKEFDDVKVMFFTASPPHMFHSKKLVASLEDLKGLKIRCTGTSAKVAKALGAVPVAMPMSEAYDALSKGVTQGIICPYEPMKGWKLAEVISHTAEYGSAYTNMTYVVMNQEKWKSMPADAQKIIEQVNKEWIERMGKLWDELNQEGKNFFIQKGGKITVLTKEENERWAKSLRPILDAYVNNIKSKGLPAEEALTFCIDYLKKHQK